MGIIILAFATLFCVVQSQLCVSSGAVPQVVTSTPIVCAPQMTNTPVVATTIIDNSVSVALANALQLLIISNIIDKKLGEPCLSDLINLNAIETPCCPRVEVLQPTAEYVSPIVPCTSSVEIIPPFRPVIERYPYLGADIVSPNFGFTANCNPCGTEIVNIPYNNACFRGYNELLVPIPYNSCGDIATPFNPCGVTELISPCESYYGGIPEVISPISSCNCGCFGNVAEFVAPFNTFGGISEIITPGCGIAEVIQPCSPYCGGFPEVISPIYRPGCAGLPDLLPNNPFGPREIFTPCTNFPEVLIPNQCNPGCSGCDFCGPAFTPNFCGVKEIVNPGCSFAPIAAEVLNIPSSIPAQLTCNYGYSPCFGQCVNFDVEPLPFGSGFCC